MRDRFQRPRKDRGLPSESIRSKAAEVFPFGSPNAILDGPLLAKARSLEPDRHLANTNLKRHWRVALLGFAILLLWTGSGMAAGRVLEFLPKAQPADFFPG